MKFILVGLLAALAIQTEASRYNSNSEDFFANDILTKYGSKYENSNVGLGQDNRWSGENNKWVGNSNRIQGSDQFVIGNQNDVNGRNNNVKGDRNQINGQNSRIDGQNNRVTGEGNVVIGSGNIVRNSQQSQDLDTESWFPDWMKQPKASKTQDTYSHKSLSKSNNRNDFDINFPSWMNDDNYEWKTPKRQSSKNSRATNSRSPYSEYNSYSRRPVISNYEREYRYPYATSFYYPQPSYSQPSYYSPWNSWQQFYKPSYNKLDFFSQPYQSNRNSYRYQR